MSPDFALPDCCCGKQEKKAISGVYFVSFVFLKASESASHCERLADEKCSTAQVYLGQGERQRQCCGNNWHRKASDRGHVVAITANQADRSNVAATAANQSQIDQGRSRCPGRNLNFVDRNFWTSRVRAMLLLAVFKGESWWDIAHQLLCNHRYSKP